MWSCLGSEGDEERTSPLINVKAAQQDASAQGQQPPLSHTQLCFSNSAWWETPPPTHTHTHTLLSLSKWDRDDKKHSWKGQMEACLDMLKPTIRLLEWRRLGVQTMSVFPGGVCTFCLFFTCTVLLGFDGLAFWLLWKRITAGVFFLLCLNLTQSSWGGGGFWVILQSATWGLLFLKQPL